MSDTPHPEKSEEPDDLSFARPRPVIRSTPDDARLTALGQLTLICGAVAGAFIVVGGTMTPCIGATRSARLEWQRRQELIDLAAHQAATNELASHSTPEVE